MWRRWSAAAVIALLTAGVVGCGSAQSAVPAKPPAAKAPPATHAARPTQATAAAATAAPAKLTAVTIGTPSISDSLMPVLMAQKEGYYARAGYRVTFERMNTSTGLAALSAGEIAFDTPTDITVPAASRGLPIKVVMSFLASPEFSLVVGKRIRSPSQLRGATIGIDEPGTQTYFGARAMLRQIGVNPDSVKFLSVGRSGTLRMQALVEGHVAATVAAADAMTHFPAADYRVVATLGNNLAMPGYGLATSDRMIQNDPGEVQAIITATLRGLRAFRSQKQAALGILRAQFHATAAAASAMWQEFDRHLSPDGTMTAANMKAEVATNPTLNGKDPAHLLAQTTDMSFVHHAVAQLGS